MSHVTDEKLIAGLGVVRESPTDEGVVHLIVRRPAVDVREVLEIGHLDTSQGLIGDTWHVRRSSRTEDGSAHPDMQLTLMNSRLIAMLAGDRQRWPEAGDQLYVDLDLSSSNLTPGTQLALGTALIAVTDQPHTGCKKFAARFGVAAARLVASAEGRALNLRGVNARVVRSGVVRAGDVVRKVGAAEDERDPRTETPN